MKKISFDQNIKLKKKEKKLAEIIALPIALILIILFYIIKITAKGLYKVKMQLTKLSIVLFVLYSLFSFFQQVAYAPEADASEYHVIAQPVTEKDRITNYIHEVFGEDAPLAFKVLSCENSAMNPQAVNTAGNVPAGSRDIGVFQINEYWQKTQGKFLFNWKINVEIAHQLFEENGKSFRLWTCGRKLNI